MKFSYSWLKELVPKLPKPNKLAELLTLKSFEVERVNRIKGDTVLSIDILPNRLPDCGGHMGLAREISALTGSKVRFAPFKFRESAKSVRDVLRVAVKEKMLCPRYIARVVEGVKIKPSPRWLQSRLNACGLKSINNVVDAANYVMLETGEPLHAFDYDKIAGHEIFVRRALNGESMTSLDGENYLLDDDMLLIADQSHPIAIAGIKGGRRAEITKETKRVVLEAANFYRGSLRKTSRKLGLITDSFLRFSQGLSPELADLAMERLPGLIQEIAGGVVLKGMIDEGGEVRKKSKILFRVARASSLLGIAVSSQESERVLKCLGFGVEHTKKEDFLLVPPRFRQDITTEEDVIEEIGRMKGYDKIPHKHPLGELVPPIKDNRRTLSEKLRDVISHIGFSEVINYAFESADDIKLFNAREIGHVKLRNPASEESAFLRASLFHGLLKNVRENFKYTNQVSLFEIGRIFSASSKGIKEEEHFSAIIAYKNSSDTKARELFLEAKGFISALLESMGVGDYWFSNSSLGDRGSWPFAPRFIMHPYRSSFIKNGEDVLGTLFEIHPELCLSHDIAGRVVAFEFLMPKLLTFLEREKEFRTISRFPSIIRDLALLVPLDVSIDTVLDVIENSAGILLVDTDLFDYYEGSEVPDGQRNLAFRLIFQSTSYTLKDEDIDKIMQKITRRLESHLSWEVRK